MENLLGEIKNCKSCYLMSENDTIGIEYVPVLPKSGARVVFLGRDPSPRTAEIVGVRDSKSSFIREVFEIAGEAGIPDKDLYITDLCKCHWRTSAGGKPLDGTEIRSNRIDPAVITACFNQWLIREIELLSPGLIIGFGEEIYDFLRPFISFPDRAPEEFSASKDKSVPDAELWVAKNGAFTVGINDSPYQLAVIRHPGSSARLPVSDTLDQRRSTYEKSRENVISMIAEMVEG